MPRRDRKLEIESKEVSSSFFSFPSSNRLLLQDGSPSSLLLLPLARPARFYTYQPDSILFQRSSKDSYFLAFDELDLPIPSLDLSLSTSLLPLANLSLPSSPLASLPYHHHYLHSLYGRISSPRPYDSRRRELALPLLVLDVLHHRRRRIDSIDRVRTEYNRVETRRGDAAAEGSQGVGGGVRKVQEE